VREKLRAFAPELVALAGFVAVVSGVALQAGAGWALIVGGAPWPAVYVAHELRAPRRRGRD
jgi:hypothetical protein